MATVVPREKRVTKEALDGAKIRKFAARLGSLGAAFQELSLVASLVRRRLKKYVTNKATID